MFKETGWSGRDLGTEVQWISTNIQLKNETALTSCADDLLEKFREYILAPIRERFLRLSAPDEESEGDEKVENSESTEIENGT